MQARDIYAKQTKLPTTFGEQHTTPESR